MAEFGKVPDAQYLEIWNPAGTVVERSASLGAADIAPPASARRVSFWNISLPNGRPGRGVRVTFTPGVEVEPDAAPDAEAEADGPATAATHRDRFVLALLRDLTPVKGVERVLLSSLLATSILLCGGTLAVVPLMVGRRWLRCGGCRVTPSAWTSAPSPATSRSTDSPPSCGRSPSG